MKIVVLLSLILACVSCAKRHNDLTPEQKAIVARYDEREKELDKIIETETTLLEIALQLGKNPNWTRILVQYPAEIPAALNYLEQAYLYGKNDHRKEHGMPKTIKGITTK